jgi:hypothetical protein
MGKAAENEGTKLRATWWNNLSIGLFLAGILIPYLTAFTKTEEVRQFFGDWLHGNPQLTDPQVREIIAAACPFAAAMFLSWRWKKRASEK